MWLGTCKKGPWILGMAFMQWVRIILELSHYLLPCSPFCPVPGCWYLLNRSLYIQLVSQLLWLSSKVYNTWHHLPLMACGVCVFSSHRAIANKETVKGAPTTPPKLSEEWIDRTPISKSFPERSIFAYFKCCYLRILFPISLHLGDDWNLPLWDSGISSTVGTPNKVSWTITNVWEATKR